jgi:mRNA interferase MazF
VAHQARGFDPGGFDVQGLGSVPNAKLMRRLGLLDASTLTQVEAAVKAWLGLG